MRQRQRLRRKQNAIPIASRRQGWCHCLRIPAKQRFSLIDRAQRRACGNQRIARHATPPPPPDDLSLAHDASIEAVARFDRRSNPVQALRIKDAPSLAIGQRMPGSASLRLPWRQRRQRTNTILKVRTRKPRSRSRASSPSRRQERSVNSRPSRSPSRFSNVLARGSRTMNRPGAISSISYGWSADFMRHVTVLLFTLV